MPSLNDLARVGAALPAFEGALRHALRGVQRVTLQPGTGAEAVSASFDLCSGAVLHQ